MNNVVALRRQPSPATYSDAFLSAWAMLPREGQLRSSRKEAYAEWRKVVAEIGEDDLVARVKRYVAEDKDHRRECGAPGFHRWLKWGRWEHWEPRAPATLHAIERREFSDPELRASFHAKFADERARRWFDRCAWDAEARKLIAPQTVRAEWFEGPFKRWALANQIQGVKFR